MRVSSSRNSAARATNESCHSCPPSKTCSATSAPAPWSTSRSRAAFSAVYHWSAVPRPRRIFGNCIATGATSGGTSPASTINPSTDARKRRRAVGHPDALREPGIDDRPGRAVLGGDLRQHGRDVRHVVGDGLVAILFGHPVPDHVAGLAVEAIEGLHADQPPGPIAGNAAQRNHVNIGILFVAVKAAHRAGCLIRGRMDQVAAVNSRGNRVNAHLAERINNSSGNEDRSSANIPRESPFS